jgi:hypothetical protein
MGLFSRQNCLALVLLLLLSHAAMTLHVSTHIPVDQTSCEYCAGNANPAHAVPTPMVDLPTVVLLTIGHESLVPVKRLATTVHYRERAPPVPV